MSLLCLLACVVSEEKFPIVLISSSVMTFFHLTSFKSCLFFKQFEYDDMTHLCVWNFFSFLSFFGGIEFNDNFPHWCFLNILDLVADINFGKQLNYYFFKFTLSLSLFLRDCSYVDGRGFDTIPHTWMLCSCLLFLYSFFLFVLKFG